MYESVSKDLTKREWFAGMAMQRLLEIWPNQPRDFVSRLAFEHADSMILESKKPEKKSEGHEAREILNQL